MGSFNFIPLPNAIPTAAKSSTGAKLETNGSLASKPNGKPFQTILTQATEKLQTQKSESTVKFKDLPEELQKLIREKFGITKQDDVQLIQLPANAVRMDENGELRISLEEIEPLLKEQTASSKFHFLDVKNGDIDKNQSSEMSELAEIKLDGEDELKGLNRLMIVPDANESSEIQPKTLFTMSEQTNDTPEFLLQHEFQNRDVEELDIESKLMQAGLVELQNQNANKPESSAIQILEQSGQPELQNKTQWFEKQSSNLENSIKDIKQDVIQLKPEMAGQEVVQQLKDGESQVFYFHPTENAEEGLLLPDQLEIKNELAQEIAKLEKNKSDEKSEYLVIKSPVQSNSGDEQPVLFLINSKDIQTESNASQKLMVLKSDAVQAEKLQSIDGQIKLNFTGSDQTGGEKSGNETNDGNQSKNSSAGKLPLLTESAFQLSKSLNEQASASQSAEKTADFRAEVKSSLDQTALEMKTAAQPLQTNAAADQAGIANQAGTSTNTVTAASQTPEQVSSTITQQTSGTQSTMKPAAPVEIPQAYQDAATNQIVKGVQSSLGSERSHISIHLQPESLGKVDIQLKMENGMLTAHIVAEKESTQSMLEKNSTVLKSALEEKNIQVDKLNIGKDTSEYRQSQQEQNRSNERWKEYQQHQHEERNNSRREQNGQQQFSQEQQQQQQPHNPWQTITNYMDRFFQRSSV